MSNHFEKSFSDFLETRDYDQASEALFTVVRSAFLAGWKAAGGEPPMMSAIFHIFPDKEKQE